MYYSKKKELNIPILKLQRAVLCLVLDMLTIVARSLQNPQIAGSHSIGSRKNFLYAESSTACLSNVLIINHFSLKLISSLIVYQHTVEVL